MLLCVCCDDMHECIREGSVEPCWKTGSMLISKLDWSIAFCPFCGASLKADVAVDVTEGRQ